MIFLYYIGIGLIVVLLRSIIYMIKCVKKGIDLDTLNRFTYSYISITIWSVLIGIIIWPIRIILFNKYEKDIINSCLKYKKELEELEESK